MLPKLQNTINQLTQEFDQIPDSRKAILQQLSDFIHKKINTKQSAHLNFICTHNSRRSHLSQLWAQAAAHYYSIPSVYCYSGGTEATAFNPRAVKAMQAAGFDITIKKEGDNPTYLVRFANEAPAVEAFSKKYDDPFNHLKDFAAVMTCSHADENCPLILGASARIALTYNDPKEFDGTALETIKYNERVRQIGREIFFAFSLLKHNRVHNAK